jgi:Domain of unknown function (DUF4265)
MSADAPTAKVLFRVVGDGDEVNVETLWAFDLGDSRYRLDNSPFYAYSVSCGDVVLAPLNPDEMRPTFESVVEKSGNRTVRLLLDTPAEPGNASDDLLKGLVEMGCDYEGAGPRYIAVNIPPTVELAAVRDYLVENASTWEHADPSFSELYPDDT